MAACHGYRYAGMEFTYECFCGNELHEIPVDPNECDHKCPGDESQDCGGAWRINIREINSTGNIYTD